MKKIRKLILVTMITLGSIAFMGCHTIQPPGPPGLPPPPPIPAP